MVSNDISRRAAVARHGTCRRDARPRHPGRGGVHAETPLLPLLAAAATLILGGCDFGG
jgi:hypothetical protein